MAGKQAVSLAADESQAIVTIVEPWLHVTGFGQPYPVLLVMARGPYSIEAYAKPDLTTAVAGPGNDPARAYRRVLLDRAEDALAALADAGWQLTGYPRMEFTGDVEPFSQFLDGTLGEPSRQYGIQLTVRFQVNRPR